MHALLISLQGVANVDKPRLYFLYPENWDFNFSGPLMEYYKKSRNMEFTELQSPEEALNLLSRYVKGYIVWDKNVRTSLIVAFTAADKLTVNVSSGSHVVSPAIAMLIVFVVSPGANVSVLLAAV